VVTSITEPMLASAREIGVPADRLVLLPNWADLSLVHPLDRPSRFRAELGIPAGRPVVLYSGNLGRKQGVITLGDAARRSQDAGSPALYVVSGAGAEHQALAAGAAAHGLTNLLRLPLQPDEAFNELLNLADVHLIIQEAGVADLVMPSKLTNMLASGRPVVATAPAGTGLARLIAENDVGTVVEPGDPGALAAAVDRLLADDDRRARQGANARAFAETHLARDELLKTAFERLQNVATQRGLV
jgi:putative colanic acid biosynthesis glycosyltransferase WcaI